MIKKNKNKKTKKRKKLVQKANHFKCFNFNDEELKTTNKTRKNIIIEKSKKNK